MMHSTCGVLHAPCPECAAIDKLLEQREREVERLYSSLNVGWTFYEVSFSINAEAPWVPDDTFVWPPSFTMFDPDMDYDHMVIPALSGPVPPWITDASETDDWEEWR